jgi:superfamily II DNA or RNA helicase
VKCDLSFHVEKYGLVFTLSSVGILGRKSVVAPCDWDVSSLGERGGAAGLLLRLHEEYPGHEVSEGIVLPHKIIAALCQSQAHILKLPPITPLSLSMQSFGNISQNDFRIDADWLTPQGMRAAGCRRVGAMLRFQGGWQRLPHTLYTLCEAIDAHNGLSPAEESERRRYLAKITDSLPEEAQKQVHKDGFLAGLRVYHAAALSLNLVTREGEFDFLPILFGQHTEPDDRRDEDSIEKHESAPMATESEALLPPAYRDVFLKHYTKTYSAARPSYVLGDNRFVFLEPMLQRALEVVREIRRADTKTRREFARTPQRFFKERLGDSFDESALESMFVATQEYSDRVIGLGLWIQKTLPWRRASGRKWMEYGISAGAKNLHIGTADAARKYREQVESAIANGRKTAVITGSVSVTTEAGADGGEMRESIGEIEVLATRETVDALKLIEGILTKKTSTDDDQEAEASDVADSAEQNKLIFLFSVDNVERIGFSRFRPRASILPDYTMPVEVKTRLKPHQDEALRWLIRMWSAGYNGALLADDMGLGKTLTCLVFLRWLKQRRRDLNRKPAPALIVAPASLIGNWQTEAENHLHAPGLGDCLVARGALLRAVRLDAGKAGRDIDDGTSRLDGTILGRADWILVTYETLRDYHHSFAAVPLSVAVFDEMQKAKNPVSQVHIAVKVLNAEFYLGMTGTPIENSLTDLWALMDILLPSFLGEGREFNRIYENPTDDALKELKNKLEGESRGNFRPMLRRMKSETLIGLPQKTEHTAKPVMPEPQAAAYEKALSNQDKPLRLLHALSMISLHPCKPEEMDKEEYSGASARFMQTLVFLDAIHSRKEKALVFLESRDHQEPFADLLRKRYNLARLPRILNGLTPAASRQKYVREFQTERDGFGVMILSPKAAGVGLTLTAANHVIHLSRWWNPAVEDQCTDRVYRLGQDKDVHVYYPLAVHNRPHLSEFSFDLKLHQLLECKRTASRNALKPLQTGLEETELYDMVKGSGA